MRCSRTILCERKTTLVVQGNTIYQYWPRVNLVNILDGSQIEDLRYWYEGAMISPWLTGKLLETLKLVGRGWEQTVVTDPNTGKEEMVVTCSHPKSNVSALLVVDPESKLVLKAKLWKNLHREDQEPMKMGPAEGPISLIQALLPVSIYEAGRNFFQAEEKYCCGGKAQNIE